MLVLVVFYVRCHCRRQSSQFKSVFKMTALLQLIGAYLLFSYRVCIGLIFLAAILRDYKKLTSIYNPAVASTA